MGNQEIRPNYGDGSFVVAFFPEWALRRGSVYGLFGFIRVLLRFKVYKGLSRFIKAYSGLFRFF